MKVILILVLFMVSTICKAQSPVEDPHWVLDKEWNFQGMSFDTLIDNWIINPCAKKLIHGVYPESYTEPQSYSPENISLAATGLQLTVKRDTVYEKASCWRPADDIMNDNLPNLRTSYYTSGWVETRDSLKYGYIEGRMKIPYGYDFFPAFWTFKMSSAAANGAEIDVFEMLPGEDILPPFYPNNFNIQKTNVHLIYGGDAPSYNENIVIADYRNYHTYGVAWTPYEIRWYFDDVLIRTLENPGIHDFTKTIINLALNPYGLDGTKTDYPSTMEIEYVKWYKWNTDCELIINDCSFWFGGYESSVKKSITIGAGGCGNVQPSGTNLVLRATDHITLYGDFEVPLGAALLVDVDPKNCYE